MSEQSHVSRGSISIAFIASATVEERSNVSRGSI